MKKTLLLAHISRALSTDRKVLQPLWVSDTVPNLRKLNELPLHLLHAGGIEELKRDVLGKKQSTETRGQGTECCSCLLLGIPAPSSGKNPHHDISQVLHQSYPCITRSGQLSSFHIVHPRNTAMAALTGSPEPCSGRFFCLCPLRDEDNPHRSVGQASCLGAFLPGAHGAAVPAAPELCRVWSHPMLIPLCGFLQVEPYTQTPHGCVGSYLFSKVGSFLGQIQLNNISDYPSVMN
ncbi:hypothetical protein Nmel_018111 [Mimus melanotis]